MNVLQKQILTYFVATNNNDPLVVYQTDIIDNNDFKCYKTAYINSITGGYVILINFIFHTHHYFLFIG